MIHTLKLRHSLLAATFAALAMIFMANVNLAQAMSSAPSAPPIEHKASPDELINERYNLRNLPQEDKDDIKWMIERLRHHGSPEDDVDTFLDELAGEFDTGSYMPSLFKELIIGNAYAQSRNDGFWETMARIMVVLSVLEAKRKLKKPKPAKDANKDAEKRAKEKEKKSDYTFAKNRDGTWTATSKKRNYKGYYSKYDSTPFKDRGKTIYKARFSETFVTLKGGYKRVASPNEHHNNATDGARRQAYVQKLLTKEYPNSQGYYVQTESYLCLSDGRHLYDKQEKSRRRLDHVVIMNGNKAVLIVETTSPNADKTQQEAKESRIMSRGGHYIRHKKTGIIINLKGVERETKRISYPN